MLTLTLVRNNKIQLTRQGPFFNTGFWTCPTIPPSSSHFVTAPEGHGEGIPRNPFGRFARFAHNSSNPQSLCDSPRGGTGKGFPETPSVASRALRTIPPTPSHFVTAPVGHGEGIPRNPFGRFAPIGRVDRNAITSTSSVTAFLSVGSLRQAQ